MEVEEVVHKRVRRKMWAAGRMSPNKHYAGNFQIIYSTYIKMEMPVRC